MEMVGKMVVEMVVDMVVEMVEGRKRRTNWMGQFKALSGTYSMLPL